MGVIKPWLLCYTLAISGMLSEKINIELISSPHLAPDKDILTNIISEIDQAIQYSVESMRAKYGNDPFFYKLKLPHTSRDSFALGPLLKHSTTGQSTTSSKDTFLDVPTQTLTRPEGYATPLSPTEAANVENLADQALASY